MAFSSDIANLGEDGFTDSGGVKIHYVTKGTGPLVVLIHGIPDFWYSWRYQIPALAEHFQVVAIDLRGYNLSDQPKGVDNYGSSEKFCNTTSKEDASQQTRIA
jgi:pimeloyl-ACP methyl ester carboxylesterase